MARRIILYSYHTVFSCINRSYAHLSHDYLAALRMKALLVLLCGVAVVLLASSSAPPQCPKQQWPVPYERHTSRPPSDPFCKVREHHDLQCVYDHS